MKARYYAAQYKKSLLYVVADLGKPEIRLSISNNKLDWFEIVLNKEQRLGLQTFLNETPME